MPLTNTAVIPDEWSQAHQPVAESAMRSRVDILLPLDQVPSPGWGEDPGDPVGDAVAAGGVHARIRSLSTGNTLAPSGQSNDTADYLVQVPANALPSLLVGENGHRLRITINPGSPALEGRLFTIMGIQHSTEAFARDLICREHVTQTQAA